MRIERRLRFGYGRVALWVCREAATLWRLPTRTPSSSTLRPASGREPATVAASTSTREQVPFEPSDWTRYGNRPGAERLFEALMFVPGRSR